MQPPFYSAHYRIVHLGAQRWRVVLFDPHGLGLMHIDFDGPDAERQARKCADDANAARFDPVD